MFAVAAHTGSQEPTLVDLPEPGEPGAGRVLCRTLQLGVCGTDREILHSAAPLVPPDCDFLALGHECLGRVEVVGPGVNELAVGDLVVPVVRRAFPNQRHRVDLLAFGTFTERGIVREHGFSPPWWLDRAEYLLRVDPVLAEVAVLAEPLAVAEKGVNEAIAVQRARLGDDAWIDEAPRVLVTGMGPIAFAAVVACRCRDWPVTMYGRDEPDSFRAGLAESFGARYVPAARGAIAPPDVEQHGYDLVLECTGSDELMMESAAALASRGVLSWLGSTRLPQPAPRNVARLMRDAILRNHVFIGCVNSAPRDFAAALCDLTQMLRAHPREIAALITDRVPPRDSLDHYRRRRPQGIKTVLMYD